MLLDFRVRLPSLEHSFVFLVFLFRRVGTKVRFIYLDIPFGVSTDECPLSDCSVLFGVLLRNTGSDCSHYMCP